MKFSRIVAEGRSVIPEAEVNFLAPITHMDKLACVGLNYSGHCKEQNVEPPPSPVIFSKFASNIIGPTDNIQLPEISDVSNLSLILQLMLKWNIILLIKERSLLNKF